jgi:MFS family permease
MALYVLVFMGTTPVGSLFMGWLASTYGPRSTIWLGGAVSLFGVGAAFAVRCWMRDLRVHVHLHPVRLHLGESGAATTMCVAQPRPAVR